MSKRASKPSQAPAHKVVYVGPSITNVAVRNTTYGELPENLSKAIQTAPWLAGLCVPIPELGQALEQIERGQGSIYTLYQKALADSAAIQKGVMEHGI